MSLRLTWPSLFTGHWDGVVGAENGVTSCDLRIFVDQAAESVAPQHLNIRARCGRMDASGWRVLLQRPVRAVALVMVGVLAQDQMEVPFAGDVHPVQALVAGAERSRSGSGQRS